MHMSSRTGPYSAALAERWGGLIGRERVADGAEIAIYGRRPSLQVRPADVEQLGAVLALADSDRLAVCVAGGATKLGWGNRPDRFDLLVSTRDLCSTCAVDADDLTMTVGAGVTVGDARARARAMNRVLPLDSGRQALATIGGVTATGDQGARGAGYGRLRDLILGLRATLADGTPVAFGGRTMKNVAGYDMTKLFVGSFGVLGVITEITFRLLPRPDDQGLLVLPLSSLAQGEEVAAKVMDSCLQPLVLEVVSERLSASLGHALPSQYAAAANAPLLLAGFAGHPSALARSVADVSAWSGVPDGTILADAEAETVFEALTDLSAAGTGCAPCGQAPTPEGAGPDAAWLSARAFIPISEVWELARTAESLAAAAGLALAYRIGAAHGTLDLWLSLQSPAEPDPESLGACVASLRAAAVASGGQLSVTNGLGALPNGFDPWGDLGPAVRIMKRIKERFDPHRTLNPGRFVGGI